MHKFRLILVVYVCLSMIATFYPTHPLPATAQQENVPRFEASPCPGDLAASAPPNLECGYMVVRENRNDPSSHAIRFPVYIFRALNATPAPDPLVYLEGGPGAGGSRLLPYFQFLFTFFNFERDVILFDQRGTGFAEPSLACDAYGLANFEAYAGVGPFSVEDGAQHAADALLTCYNQFSAQGIDMNAYTSASSAADLDELRQALGYAQWNLYGISYGTRLALTTMRDFPAGIRSVVIDSVVPVQGNLYPETPLSGAGAIDRLFDLCAADTACNSTYPDLERIFYATVDRLNAEPVVVQLERPLDGRIYDAELDGNLLVGILFYNLYSSFAIRSLPYAIYSAYAGDFAPLSELVVDYFIWDDIATGMHYGVNCNEEIAFNTAQQVENASADLEPRLVPFFDMDNYITLDICAAWNAPTPNPIENEAVVSDIPTLVLTGQLDPITPPHWAEMAAQTLSNSFLFIVPGGGHGVSFSYDCVQRIMGDFLDNPTREPNSACLNRISGPAFEIIPVAVD